MTQTQHDRDYEAFVALFTRHERFIRGFVRALLPASQDLDDVMQEVGLVCWRKFSAFQPSDNPNDFMKWACVIARFEAMRQRRKHARDQLVLNDDIYHLLADDAEQRLEQSQAEQLAVQQCLQQLGESERRLLLSVYAPGDSIAKIAKELGQKARRLYSKVDALRTLIAECVRSRLADGRA